MLMELGFIGRNRLFSLYLYREMSLFGGSNLGCFGVFWAFWGQIWGVLGRFGSIWGQKGRISLFRGQISSFIAIISMKVDQSIVIIYVLSLLTNDS